MRLLIFIFLNFLLLTGCSTTLFQKEVPSPIPSSDIVVYSTTQERLYDLNESVTQGKELKPITTNEIYLNRRVSNELIQQNEFFGKHQGKPIEGTGIDLSMIVRFFWIIVILAVITTIFSFFGPIITPIIAPFITWLLRKEKKTLTGIVKTIQGISDSSTVGELKNQLSVNLSGDDKVMVSKIKQEK